MIWGWFHVSWKRRPRGLLRTQRILVLVAFKYVLILPSDLPSVFQVTAFKEAFHPKFCLYSYLHLCPPHRKKHAYIQDLCYRNVQYPALSECVNCSCNVEITVNDFRIWNLRWPTFRVSWSLLICWEVKQHSAQ
jgi:hypothetical protein